MWSAVYESFKPARNPGEKCTFSHDLDDEHDDVPLSLCYKRRRTSVAQTSVWSPPDLDNDCLTGASVVDPIAPEQVVDSPTTEPPDTPLVSEDVNLPASPAVLPADITADECATAILQTSEIHHPVGDTSPSQTVAGATQQLPSDVPLDEFLDASGESDIESEHGTTYGAQQLELMLTELPSRLVEVCEG